MKNIWHSRFSESGYFAGIALSGLVYILSSYLVMQDVSFSSILLEACFIIGIGWVFIGIFKGRMKGAFIWTLSVYLFLAVYRAWFISGSDRYEVNSVFLYDMGFTSAGVLHVFLSPTLLASKALLSFVVTYTLLSRN